ncbi:MAG: archaeosortase/exosortase family protein [Nanoarchaeota archaeon]|nr:archaeosortase/exosortase family protein [Nanoarchaeota archaeon]
MKKRGRGIKISRKNYKIIIFLLNFFIFLFIFNFIFWNIIVFRSYFLNHIASVLYKITSVLGLSLGIQGNIVILKNYNFEIIYECTGIFSMMIFSSCILAYPTENKKKLIGIIFGIISLYLINLVRLIILAIIGNFFPKFFDLFHKFFWQATLILFVILLFLIWKEKIVDKNEK